jgi:hypothetical protein
MPCEGHRTGSDLVNVRLRGTTLRFNGGVLAGPRPAADARKSAATAGKRSSSPAPGTRSR